MTILNLLRRTWRLPSLKQKTLFCFCTALLVFLTVPVAENNVSAAGGKKAARIWLQEPHGFTPDYQGSSEAMGSWTSGPIEPRSLASADFTEQGVADLAVGYSTGQGGLLVVHPGNLDAIAPQSLESWKATAAGEFPPPFLKTAMVSVLPGRPDFLVSGRMVGMSHTDLLAATAGAAKIDVLAGDGHGHFAPAQTLAIPGALTALAAGHFGPHRPFSQVLIGVEGSQQPLLLLYSGSKDGLRLQASFPLPAPATAIALGDLDGDALPDAAILAGGRMYVLHSVSQNNHPVLEALNLPLDAGAMALGRFVFDRDPRLQIALLAPDGAVHIIAHNKMDSRFWTLDELKAMWRNRTQPRTARVQPSLGESWSVVESVAGVAPFTDTSHPPLLLSLRNSGYGQDDVVALNGETGQMAMVSHPNLKPGDLHFTSAELSVRPYSGGRPVAVAAARVNADARKGMVTLHQGQVGPFLLEPLPDPTFSVNTTADTVDANPGDGKCADAQGNCSLRAAVMEANASPGVDTIVVPAGTFTLTIPDNGLGNASGGPLSITDGVNIIGASMNTTIIQAGTTSSNGLYHVFSISPLTGTNASFDTLLSNLTVQFGQAGATSSDPFGGAFDWDAGANGTGNITLSSVNLNSNFVGFLTPQNGGPFGGDGGGALFTNNIGGTTGTVTITNSIIQNNVAQDGGGGIWVGSGIPLSVSNTQVLNNQAVGSGAQQGGGILLLGPNGSSQSAIQNTTTISGNHAGSQGGGIYTTEGLLINPGTVITGNVSSGDGGGLWSNVTNETTTVSSSTITGNSATGLGGGIEVDNNNVGNNFAMTFSRIVGNSAGTGSGLNNAAGSVTVTDDWWGCNTGPSAAPCDLVTGTVTSSPWITLSHTANPASLAVGANATLTASFLQDSNGGTISAGNLGALIGLPITFGNALNGTISNAQTTIQSTGTATATFTAAVFTTNQPGVAQASATVDKATATANMTVAGFNVAISQASQTVLAGNSTSYTITVTPVNGFNGTVTLSSSGCPANTTCSLNPTSIPGASGTATLSVATKVSTPAASPVLTVSGVSGTATASATTTLVVQDFALTVTPASQPVDVGSTGAYTVKVIGKNGFRGTVTPSVTGLPAGATASFSPATMTFPVTVSTMNICTSSATVECSGATGVTPDANSTLTVSGSSGGQVRTQTATLSVVDFSIGVNPPSQTINAGSSATYTVTATPINNFSAPVTPSVSNLPSGATATFSPAGQTSGTGAAQTPTNGQAVSWTLTISTTTTIQAANFTLTAQETSGSLVHTAPVGLNVQDFSLTAPSLACVNAASPASGPVTLAGLNGFTGQVSLTLGPSPLPPGVTFSFNPTPVNINASGNFTSTLTINTTPATPGGNYQLTITATSGTLQHTANVTLCVENFTLAINPSSAQSINAGGSQNYTVTVSPVNGLTGQICLSLSQSSFPAPPPATISFSPSCVTITNSNPQTSTLTVSTTNALPGNVYTFTVTGTYMLNGTATALLQSLPQDTLNIKNFTLSIAPPSQTILVGASTTYTLTATPVSGYNGTVNCSVTGLPPGTTYTCPPITIASGGGAGSTTLTVNTSASTPARNTVFTVNGTDSGGFPTQSVTASLNTQDFTCSVSPATQPVIAGNSVPYTVTVSPLNGFSSPVTFVPGSLPSGVSLSFSPSPLPGGSTTDTMTASTTTSAQLTNDSLPVSCNSGPISHPLLAQGGSSAVLQVEAIQILRPTSGANGLGSGCFCGAYDNFSNAIDGNFSTFAKAPGSLQSGAFANASWSNFGSPSATPIAVNLKVSSGYSLGTNDSASVGYTFGSSGSGTFYITNGPFTQPQFTATASLPTNTDLTTVSVGAFVNESATASHQIFEIWIEVTHQ